jgi:hypothetical protein
MFSTKELEVEIQHLEAYVRALLGGTDSANVTRKTGFQMLFWTGFIVLQSYLFGCCLRGSWL